MKIHMAKKWPETVLEQLFKSNIHFGSVFIYYVIRQKQTILLFCLNFKKDGSEHDKYVLPSIIVSKAIEFL